VVELYLPTAALKVSNQSFFTQLIIYLRRKCCKEAYFFSTSVKYKIYKKNIIILRSNCSKVNNVFFVVVVT